jgi:lysophospholipase L1-like esterase
MSIESRFSRLRFLLTISIILNLVAIFYGAKRYYYTQDFSKQRIPQKSAYYLNRQTVYDLFPVTKDDIVFIGDSHTQRFDVSEYLKGYPIINRGIDYDITAGVLKRIYEVTDGKPKKVFIEIGFNDLFGGVKPAVALNNIISILKTIKQESPYTKIYLTGLFPSATKANELVPEMNNNLKKICLNFNIPFINVNSKLSKDGSLDAKFDGGDGVHLNGQGYLVWSQALKPYL